MIDLFGVEDIESHTIRRIGDETTIERRAVQIVFHVFDIKGNIVCYARMLGVFLCYGNHPRIDIRRDDSMVLCCYYFVFGCFECFVEHRLIISFERLEGEGTEHSWCDILRYQSCFYDYSSASAKKIVKRLAEFPSRQKHQSRSQRFVDRRFSGGFFVASLVERFAGSIEQYRAHVIFYLDEYFY
jgi:hypothetical protein